MLWEGMVQRKSTFFYSDETMKYWMTSKVFFFSSSFCTQSLQMLTSLSTTYLLLHMHWPFQDLNTLIFICLSCDLNILLNYFYKQNDEMYLPWKLLFQTIKDWMISSTEEKNVQKVSTSWINLSSLYSTLLLVLKLFLPGVLHHSIRYSMKPIITASHSVLLCAVHEYLALLSTLNNGISHTSW